MTRYFRLLLSVLLLSTSALRAQSYFSPTQIPYAPDPFVTSTPIALGVDDMYSAAIPLPFPFCFYGATEDSVVIGSNGIVVFDPTFASTYCPWPIQQGLPSSTLPMRAIFTPTQDLDPSQGGTISIGTYGNAPYRRFVISYESVRMFSCTGMQFSQQVILYETTNYIEVHIQDKPLCASWNQGAAILGMQGSTTDFVEAPGRTWPTQWATTQESWQFAPAAGPCMNVVARDTIAGKVYMDYNANCTLDGADFGVYNAVVYANGGAFYDWTDLNGDYEMLVDTGNWTVQHFLPGPAGTVCPASGQHNVYFATTGLLSAGNDFADTTNVWCPDLTVDLSAWNMTRCLGELLFLNWCNNGWTPEPNATITVTLIDSITLDSASIPYTSLGGNTYQFNIGAITAFQCGSAILYTTIGCDSLGTVYCVNADITGTLADCDTLNNSSQDCHALVGSFDPNDKRIATHNFAQTGYAHTDTIPASQLRLQYMVRFQNTGTDVAETVIVRDTLSPLVDPSTLVMGSSSHNYHWFIDNHVLVVIYDGIMLPDSGADMARSIGFFRYSVNQYAGHLPGTVIENQAAIYFDLNPPVITNRTTHVIAEPPVANDRPLALGMKLYPNPGSDRIQLQWGSEAQVSFRLMNTLGQEVLRSEFQGTQGQAETARLQPGVYLWQAVTEGQVAASGKWVKF